MRSMNYLIIALALFVTASISPNALAAQGDSDSADLSEGFGAALPDSDLGAQRGGQDQYLNDMKLYAQLNDNKAISNVTGGNIVTQDAFAGAKGFATVIQNSGNNVIIQNATILNLRLQ